MFGVWWLLGSDGSATRCGVPLTLAAVWGLAASNRQGEHLVAVEGTPNA